MKTNHLKLTIILFALVFAGKLSGQYTNTSTDKTIPLYTDEDIRMRLRSIASCVMPRYTDVVKSYIRTYTIKHRDRTEQMLGKTVMYFPIFQKYEKNEGGRAFVQQLRKRIVDIYHKHGAIHFQVGKVYPLLRNRNEASVSMMRAIKQEVDPQNLMNPGALGL